MMKPKKVLLQENIALLTRIENSLARIENKLRKVEEWQIHDRGEFHRKFDATLKHLELLRGPL